MQAGTAGKGMSSAGQRRLQELDHRWSFWQNKSDCGNEQQHQLRKEAKVKGMGNTAPTHTASRDCSLEGGRKEAWCSWSLLLGQDQKKTWSLAFHSTTESILVSNWALSSCSAGTLTGRSKNEAAFRTALVSQLLGKDTKEEKGVWKLLRDSDVSLTKDGP